MVAVNSDASEGVQLASGDLLFVCHSGLRGRRIHPDGEQKSAFRIVLSSASLQESRSTSGARMRSAISEPEVTPRGPEKVEGMEKPKRARKRKQAKANLKPPACGTPESRVQSRGESEDVRNAGGNRWDQPEEELAGQRRGKVVTRMV